MTPVPLQRDFRNKNVLFPADRPPFPARPDADASHRSEPLTAARSFCYLSPPSRALQRSRLRNLYEVRHLVALW